MWERLNAFDSNYPGGSSCETFKNLLDELGWFSDGVFIEDQIFQ